MSTQNDAAYVDQMYAQWRDDPASVDQAWDKHFSGGSAASGDIGQILAALQSGGFSGQKDLSQFQSDGFKLLTFVRAFMTHGHMKADLDPLKLDEVYS